MNLVRLFSVFFLLLSSCNVQTSIRKAPPPVSSFVKILKKIEVKECKKQAKKCSKGTFYSTGSGIVIRHTEKNSIILTAAHVCQVLVDDKAGIKKLKSDLLVVNHKNQYFKAVVILATNPFFERKDICMIATGKMNVPTVKIGKKPNVGDQAYNISAPMGITHLPAVPILSGIYSGEAPGVHSDLYTIPAIGGSSGSAIFNEDYEVIGIVVASVRGFHHITLSVSYEDLQEFVNRGFETLDKIERTLN